MNRRTCACGTVIVCADLDGYDIWLDHSAGGWIAVDEHGRATVGAGPWRRHSCAHDPRPLDLNTPPPPNALNSDRHRYAAHRDINAARTILNSGRPLSPTQRRAAELRLNHPDRSWRQIAADAGITFSAYAAAMRDVRQIADRFTSTGATP